MSIKIYNNTDEIFRHLPIPGEVFLYQDKSESYNWNVAHARESKGILEVADLAAFKRRDDALTFAVAYGQSGWVITPPLRSSVESAIKLLDDKNSAEARKLLEKLLTDQAPPEPRVLMVNHGGKVEAYSDPGVEIQVLNLDDRRVDGELGIVHIDRRYQDLLERANLGWPVQKSAVS